MYIRRLLSLILLPAALSCTKESSPVEPPATRGAITTASFIEAARQTVLTTGGVLSINKPGDPLHGFELTVPSNGFPTSQDLVVSYGPILSHTLGANFSPLSPLIRISYGGGYSEGFLNVKIPVKLPAGHFAMGFFYDEATGRLEPVPLKSLDSGSVVLSTRHLSPRGLVPAKSFLGKSENVTGNLVISSVQASYLEGQPVLSSGFTPGVDDWEFPNYGSYIAQGGHCAGQSMTAMWYFYEKKLLGGQPPLNARFDTFNAPTRPESLWSDNPRGYRFASTIQVDQDFTNWIRNLEVQSWAPSLTYHSFLYAMLLTGEPQYVLIRNGVTGAGHAMIVHSVNPSTGTLQIADPNYPGNRYSVTGTPTVRSIQFRNGAFVPYSSALVVGGNGINFDQIGFAAKTAHINWGKLTQRWAEFEVGTIGNDRFPAYGLWVHGTTTALLGDTLTTSADTLTLHCRSGAVPYAIPGTDHYQEVWAYTNRGRYLGRGYAGNGGILRVPLAYGENTIGFYVMGANASQYANYVDFRWATIRRSLPTVDPARVKRVGVALLSVDTRWSSSTGYSDQRFSPSWIATGTMTGNSFSGSGGVTGDTVTVVVEASSISFTASGRGTLGGLGTASTRISGRIQSAPKVTSGYVSYEVTGQAACDALTSLILKPSGAMLVSYSCNPATLLGVTFYY